jgi:hypothetical protein
MNRLNPQNLFLVSFAVFFISFSAWSFADPLVTAPDEQAHIIRAYALDHGQIGSDVPEKNYLVKVSVPKSINFTKLYPVCFQFEALNPASCAPKWDESNQVVETTTYVGHYPPFYYSIVGIGSYVGSGRTAIYAMRLISSLLNALMISLGLYALSKWSKRRFTYLGYLLVTTPVVYLLGSSVNPSGFEISTSILFWTLIAIIGFEHRTDPPPGLIKLLAFASLVFSLIRGLSLLWVAIGACSLVALIKPTEVLRLLKERRDIQIATFSVGASGFLAALWIFTQGTLNISPIGAPVPPESSSFTILNLVLHRVHGWLNQSVGILGWLNIPLPRLLYDVWILLFIGAVVAGIYYANKKEKIVLATVAMLSIGFPIALVFHEAKRLGVVWQGRDSMPLLVGAIILGTALCTTVLREKGIFVVGGIIFCLTFFQLFAFWQNLRVYTVGRAGDRFFFIHTTSWSPPIPSFLLVGIYGILTLIISYSVFSKLLDPES